MPAGHFGGVVGGVEHEPFEVPDAGHSPVLLCVGGAQLLACQLADECLGTRAAGQDHARLVVDGGGERTRRHLLRQPVGPDIELDAGRQHVGRAVAAQHRHRDEGGRLARGHAGRGAGDHRPAQNRRLQRAVVLAARHRRTVGYPQIEQAGAIGARQHQVRPAAMARQRNFRLRTKFVQISAVDLIAQRQHLKCGDRVLDFGVQRNRHRAHHIGHRLVIRLTLVVDQAEHESGRKHAQRHHRRQHCTHHIRSDLQRVLRPTRTDHLGFVEAGTLGRPVQLGDRP